MNAVLLYLDLARRSRAGQAVLAFLRVAAATVAACWLDAGLPVSDLTLAEIGSWCELGVQAGAALVLVNHFGPWEKRYGHKRTTSE